jgi:hypothetical protein
MKHDDDLKLLQQVRRFLLAEEASIEQDLEMLSAVKDQFDVVCHFMDEMGEDANATEVLRKSAEHLGQAKLDNLVLMLICFAQTLLANKRQKHLRDDLETR